jgi:hypothetical protein
MTFHVELRKCFSLVLRSSENSENSENSDTGINFLLLLRLSPARIISSVFHFLFHFATAHCGPGLHFYRSFTIAHRHTTSVGLLWTSDQPNAQTSTWPHTHQSKERDYHAPGGIRTQIPSKRNAADPHFRLCSHSDRPAISHNHI